jgi:endonuclease/exonuclease/phosphatase (EEP) superfamily protein YafD
MQASSIKIASLPYPLTISAVYCPPHHNLKQIHFETFFHTLGPKFIAGGDFNSKHTPWASRLSTTKGRELYRAINDNNYLTISLGTPTYWPADANKIPDLLDFFITSGISENYISVTGSYDLSSDHTPVIATISTSIPLR